MIKPNAAAIAYLQFVLERLNVSPSSLAKSIGVSATTLTRPLNSENYKFAISTTTIAKIAAFSGINPGPFFQTRDIAQRHSDIAKGYSSHIGKEHLKDGTLDLLLKSYLPIIGKIGDVDEVSVNLAPGLFDYGMIKLLHSELGPEEVFGIAVKGNGASAIASPGEYLFCVRCQKIDVYAAQSKTYILQEFDGEDFFIDLAPYTLQISENGFDWQLVRSSHERDKNDVIPLDEIERAGERTRVIGHVRYVFREPHPIKKMQ